MEKSQLKNLLSAAKKKLKKEEVYKKNPLKTLKQKVAVTKIR